MSRYRVAAMLLAVAAGALGVWRGTWAVGGSDSSCYALMAAAFARGELQPTSPLTNDAPWPEASRTFAPGGFIPSPVRSNAASPVCAPGFSLLLAPLYAVGGRDAIFVLTPVAGAMLVFVTFVLGRQLAGDLAGLGAALVVAASPVFVFQLVQPMNDVTVAALWTAVLALATRPHDHSARMGILSGVALLVRPNLAPVAFVVMMWCLAGGVRRAIAFATGVVPFVLTVAVLNTLLYGGPLQSGYGAAGELFSRSHVADNVQNYGSALLETQLAFPLLGLAAIFVVPRHQRRVTAMLLATAITVVVIYLFYRPLPEWWYLRFLLPVLPALTVLAMAALVFGSRRPSAVIPAVILVVAYEVTSDPMTDALDLWRLEGRFRAAGAIAREQLPANAVLVSVWESGTVRYHADREALVWDALDPAALDPALVWLATRGQEPYVMIEDWEEPSFRDRFSGHSAVGNLDWPPRFDIDGRVKIYQPSDRARYLAGGTVPTQFIRHNRR